MFKKIHWTVLNSQTPLSCIICKVRLNVFSPKLHLDEHVFVRDFPKKKIETYRDDRSMRY